MSSENSEIAIFKYLKVWEVVAKGEFVLSYDFIDKVDSNALQNLIKMSMIKENDFTHAALFFDGAPENFVAPNSFGTTTWFFDSYARYVFLIPLGTKAVFSIRTKDGSFKPHIIAVTEKSTVLIEPLNPPPKK